MSKVFGEIAEGLETLTRINEAFTDEKGRPFKNIRLVTTLPLLSIGLSCCFVLLSVSFFMFYFILFIHRIKHTYILDDPFDDPPQISELIPDASPEGRPKDEVITIVELQSEL